MKHKPIVWNNEVGSEMVKLFSSIKLVPTLFFVDPWGYKGLSLQLVNAVLKDWGCDCIFFFNYNRINMGLTNPMVQEHMAALFGENDLPVIHGFHLGGVQYQHTKTRRCPGGVQFTIHRYFRAKNPGTLDDGQISLAPGGKMPGHRSGPGAPVRVVGWIGTISQPAAIGCDTRHPVAKGIDAFSQLQ